MKKFLEALINKRKKEIQDLQKRSDESVDVEEVRKISDEIKAKGEEVIALSEKLKELTEESQEEPTTDPVDDGTEETASRGFNPLGSYGLRGANPQRTNNDPYDTVAYRTAFMNFACRNVQIPSELRASATTTTSDASAVIPTTIMNEIVKELKARGGIWARVRRLNVQGGVEFPILTLKPKATWVGESTNKTDSQKLEAKTKISFSYFGLECKVSQTLLANVTTLPMFQEQFTELSVEAIIEAIEIGTFNGTGSGQMLGILKDTRVKDTQKVTLLESEFGKWKTWKEKVFGAIKLAYGNGAFYMAKSTFDGELDGMVDTNGQPIARVNYGLENEPQYRFGGKEVVPVEDDVIKPYATAVAGDVVAVFVNLQDYGVNSNMEMKMNKWEDYDTHEIKNNCMMILDGKLIDANGVVLVIKGAKTAG